MKNTIIIDIFQIENIKILIKSLFNSFVFISHQHIQINNTQTYYFNVIVLM